MTRELSYGTDCLVCPSFVDVHVHFREPGYSYKETILSGSQAAAAGGYTCVCPMPNLNPVPDTPEHISEELQIIQRDAVIEVRPYASITLGRQGLVPVDFKALKGMAVAFSDDGSGVQDDAVMLKAMELARENDCLLAAHCEDTASPRWSAESEWRQIERDLELARQTGCAYHVCHISTKQSVDVIRRAKDRGVDVTCETAPHYLLLCEDDIQDDGRFRMNPPLRTAQDREAIVEGLKDGTIDMIATDHAPHSAEEKSKGYQGSAMGIIGLETAFPVLYTGLVLPGIITIEKLIDLMSTAPRKRFRLGEALEDYAVFDVSNPFEIDSSRFLSKGRSTPFDGWAVRGRCLRTVHNGKTVYEYKG